MGFINFTYLYIYLSIVIGGGGNNAIFLISYSLLCNGICSIKINTGTSAVQRYPVRMKFFRTSENGLNSAYFAKIAHKIAKPKYFPNIFDDSDSPINSLSDNM